MAATAAAPPVRTPLPARLVALSLLVAASPVLLVAAIWIRVVAGRPVLFRASRIGYAGMTFSMFKLRTLQVRDDANEWWPQTVGPADARLIRGGAWLRTRKVDELPQLWNVLRGEMAIVGPRPEMPSALDEYSASDMQLLEILPGLTDIASLEFFDLPRAIGRASSESACLDPDAAYQKLVAAERMRLRHVYAETRSLSLDCRIAVRTARRLCSAWAGRNPGTVKSWRRQDCEHDP